MRSSEVLFSGVHLLVILFIEAVGLAIILEPHVPGLRYGIARFLAENSSGSLMVGTTLLVIGILLLFGFYKMYGKRYYKLRLSSSKVLIEKAIIQEYIESYWKGLFPEETFPVRVCLGSKQNIEIITQLPDNIEDIDALVDRIKNELGVLLARKLGYEKEFTLTITD